MTRNRDDARSNTEHDATRLSRDEERFVRQFAEVYAPTQMSGMRRAAFDATLEDKLARRQRGTLWLPSFAAVAAAAALAWWLVPSSLLDSAQPNAPSNDLRADAGTRATPTSESTSADATPLGNTASTATLESDGSDEGQEWGETLLFAELENDEDAAETTLMDDGDVYDLPDEYVAIGGMFFDEEGG